jgi:DNA-binding NarL/FixJ family response regulator
METVRVLVVVEDEPDMRVLIRVNLTADPRIVVAGEASSAAEALELAQTTSPGLIILDHQIDGDVMGLEAAPLLKQAAPQAKILLFTAFDLEEEASSNSFIDDFLPKKDLGRLLPVAQRLLGLEPL